MTQAELFEQDLKENPPREGTRAGDNRRTAEQLDTSWKTTIDYGGSAFRKRVIACANQEARDQLAAEVLETLFPAIDAAAKSGELNLMFRVPAESFLFAGAKSDKTEIYEEFLKALDAQLASHGYRLLRFDEKFGGLLDDSIERVYVCW